MEIVLTPGSLQNDNYRLNIPIAFRLSIMQAFEHQPIIIVLNNDLVVEIPNDNLTFVNWHAFAHADISVWLNAVEAAPYPHGNPPQLNFWLVNTTIGNLLIARN